MQNSEREIPQPDNMNGHSVSATSTRSCNPDIVGNILKSMSKNSTQGTPTEPRTEDRPIQSTKDKSSICVQILHEWLYFVMHYNGSII